ncbi:MAG TPA: acylphosphatase [Candidatus Paceibacterota bacterium]|nr:acylphosphatase [Candidatus Paceibacterota bacterium]
MESLYCRIFGRVQFVMFRDFATRKARSHKLVGYVRNLADGSVEAYAEGRREDLEKWLKKMNRGPFLAHVERVEDEWNVPPPQDMREKKFDSFNIVL